MLVALVGLQLPAALSPGPVLGGRWCGSCHFLNPRHMLDTVLTVTRLPCVTSALQRHRKPLFVEEGIEAWLVAVGNPGSVLCLTPKSVLFGHVWLPSRTET